MKSKIVMFAAALSLGMLFLMPMWKITLIAPQYPDGVTMYIWIDKITGNTPSTLQNINILNHYIGMKYIEPESIPELGYFKYIVMGLIALGIIVAISGRRYIFLAWCILVILLGATGIFDFYLWEYDYGHNLDEMAPIKIPGMVYQPPLIGKKTLLNFDAYSWPWIGGWFIGVAIILSYLAFRMKRNNISHEKKPVKSDHHRMAVVA